jgi:hypothetical protein
MHHSAVSNNNEGGRFSKANIFRASRTSTSSTRPSTSSGTLTAESQETHYYSFSRNSTFGREAFFSTRSAKAPALVHRDRKNDSAKFPTLSQDKRANSTLPPSRGSNSAHSGAGSAQEHGDRVKSANSLSQVATDSGVSPKSTGVDSYTSTTPFSNMLVTGTSFQGIGGPLGPSPYQPIQLPSPTLENITYHHIHETSSKRISTLDYLRKA